MHAHPTERKTASDCGARSPDRAARLDPRRFFTALASLVATHPFVCGALLVILYQLPTFILGSDAVLPIHDHLDGDHVMRILASRDNRLLDHNAVIPEVMNGLSRRNFPSGLNVTMVLYALLPPLAALLLNDLAVRLVAFVGMYLLLAHHVVKDTFRSRLIAFSVAVCFALVPFYTAYGLSVAGQPMLIHVFLRLQSGLARWHDYASIMIFALWSYLVLSGWILLLGLLAMLAVRIATTRKIPVLFLAGLALLFVTFAVVEHPLIVAFLTDASEVSHRVERFIPTISWKDAISGTIGLFLRTQYHSGTIYTALILFTAALAIPMWWPHRKARSLIVGIACIHLAYLTVQFLSPRLGDTVPILQAFQWDRVYVLLPVAWMVLFALALDALPVFRAWRWLPSLLLIGQFATGLAASPETRANLARLVGQHTDLPSYDAYYAPALFERVADLIETDRSTYRVISLGLPPAVAQYNGFFTLDSYQYDYPLEYKHRFRRIIAPELAKSDAIRIYFDHWGNRCYAFAAELGRDWMVGKDCDRVVTNLAFDLAALREMGGRYILSALPLLNHASLGLTLRGSFTDEAGYWNIRVYEVR